MALQFASGVCTPPKMVVMHSCDNRLCCNPRHLSLALQADNIHDAMQKQRHVKGETHGMHILTERDVLAILQSDETTAQNAQRYGVSKAAIYDIRQRRSWRYLTPAPV